VPIAFNVSACSCSAPISRKTSPGLHAVRPGTVLLQVELTESGVRTREHATAGEPTSSRACRARVRIAIDISALATRALVPEAWRVDSLKIDRSSCVTW